MTSPSGPTYLFLHGSPGRAEIWQSVIAAAPAGARCIAVDLIEHGAAPDAPASTADDIVADVVSRARALGGTLTLVGHSFGGWVAGRAIADLGSATEGGIVERFVAISSVPGLDAAVAERSVGFAAAMEAGQLTLAAGAAIACDLWLPAGPERRAEDVAAVTTLILEHRPDRLARVLRRHAALADPARWVAPHRVPTTSIHNTDDRGAPIALGRALASCSPKNEWIELPGDGHYPMWSHPEVVRAAVFRG